MPTIQNFIKPNYKICSIKEMYFRVNSNCYYNSIESAFEFQRFGVVDFNTYFNAFSVTSWKSNCKIDSLSLVLQGLGEFTVRIYNHRFGQGKKLLKEINISLNGSAQSIALENWEGLYDGLLFPEITALSNGVIHELSFATKTKQAVNSKLGIIITHFDRKEYVLPTIQRINNFIKESGLSRNIELVVVDNSNNITKSEEEGAVIIPNRNLGGSGGFMRGLLYLKDNEFTHCLFMDDDASCETESIFRAYQMLSYAKTKKLAIAGGLLDEKKMNTSIEKGAIFNGVSCSVKSNYNMESIKDLLSSDKEFSNLDYGGWWFFMFKIDDVKKFTFPYFVKGDDITFSIDNEFSIISPIGICCWAEKFGLKSSPFYTYLWARFLLVQPLIYSKYKSHTSLLHLIKQGVLFAAAGKYESVIAIIQAHQDIRKGPDFWLKNIDTIKVREYIKEYNLTEKMYPINLKDFNPIVFTDLHKNSLSKVNKYKEPLVRKLFRRLLIQGYLLPFLFRNNLILQEKDYTASFPEVFMYKRILHYDFVSQSGFITERSFIKFWQSVIKLILSTILTLVNYKNLNRLYGERHEEMTSESFWRINLRMKD